MPAASKKHAVDEAYALPDGLLIQMVGRAEVTLRSPVGVFVQHMGPVLPIRIGDEARVIVVGRRAFASDGYCRAAAWLLGADAFEVTSEGPMDREPGAPESPDVYGIIFKAA